MSAGEITLLLRQVAAGDRAASDRLFELTYAQLSALTRSHRFGNGDAVLDTGAIVHEAYLRYFDRGPVELPSRAAFYGYMARIMRSFVLDQVRARRALKRGSDRSLTPLTTNVGGERLEDLQILALNEALDTLEQVAPALHAIVELRYFAGLSIDEIAEHRGLSPRSVSREWQKARALLRTLLAERSDDSTPPARDQLG
jgi:RNA polymerase sigma factor (TIGR02999 family)